MEENVLSLVRGRQGHFKLESGHHGDLWLELEALCLHSREIRPFAAQLAAKLVQHRVEVVCGPLVEGAFIALLVSLELGCDFVYAERFADGDRRIRATFEIVWLSGWAPHESQQKPLAPGSARQRLADALGTKEIPAGEKTGR